MTITAHRSIDITLEELGMSETFEADANLDSPGQIQIVTLANGNNTITVPSGGTTPVAVTILKPSDNTTSITLKGVNVDTGVRLHNTDPDTISLHSGVSSFVLAAGAEIVGVRLIWT